MGVRLRVFLTPEQNRTLFELRTAHGVPQRTKDRAEALRLNASGWHVEKIATYLNWNIKTVRQTINRWNTQGLGGLWDAPRQGASRRWQEADMIYLEEMLEKEPRTYNSRQLAEQLAAERQVPRLPPSRPNSTGTQKKGIIWKRNRTSHKDKQDPVQRQIKQADLDMLELAAACGEIQLKYLDESGFCLWSPVSYSYIRRGQRKRLEQGKRRGKRLSILGLWQPCDSFFYGLALGSFTSASYIRLMDWEAEKALHRLKQTGCITVVVEDNGSLHTSTTVRAKWSEWEKKGLYIFFLPKYCSEMNRIENEWQLLKFQELGGRIFEDEYDLAVAVMEAVQSRCQQRGDVLERFKFNSM